MLQKAIKVKAIKWLDKTFQQKGIDLKAPTLENRTFLYREKAIFMKRKFIESHRIINFFDNKLGCMVLIYSKILETSFFFLFYDTNFSLARDILGGNCEKDGMSNVYYRATFP